MYIFTPVVGFSAIWYEKGQSHTVYQHVIQHCRPHSDTVYISASFWNKLDQSYIQHFKQKKKSYIQHYVENVYIECQSLFGKAVNYDQ